MDDGGGSGIRKEKHIEGCLPIYGFPTVKICKAGNMWLTAPLCSAPTRFPLRCVAASEDKTRVREPLNVKRKAGLGVSIIEIAQKKNMTFADIIRRKSPPIPWDEGGKIPWNDTRFSERMLEWHLSQDTDLASRRFVSIEKHIDWIHYRLLSASPARILDLGCGPGFYTTRLSRLGHECVGIDFSPASIKFAIDQAEKNNLKCRHIHQDIREADYGSGYGLVMLIFGEFNVFSPADAISILKKANRALAEDGLLLLEPQTFSAVRETGQSPSSWHSEEKGLFSDEPYILLNERFWDKDSAIATERYFVIDCSKGDVTRYASSAKAYIDEEYSALLQESNFHDVKFYPSLTGVKDASEKALVAIVAHKKRANRN